MYYSPCTASSFDLALESVPSQYKTSRKEHIYVKYAQAIYVTH